ncbi:MAG: protein TolR [Pseudomonadota bacterium]
MSAGLNRREAGHGGRRYRPMSEINVTPFVDVMLVLLIIFMVTAPLLTLGVPVDLPKANAKPLGEDQKPLQLSIDRNGAIFIEDTEIDRGELLQRLSAIAAERNDPRIYIRADQSLAYGDVMVIIAEIKTSGFEKLALISDPRAGSDGP